MKTSPQYEEEPLSSIAPLYPPLSLNQKFREQPTHVLEPATTSQLNNTPDNFTTTQPCFSTQFPNVPINS